MPGAERDGEDDLRRLIVVEFVAVAQQHPEQKSAADCSAVLLL